MKWQERWFEFLKKEKKSEAYLAKYYHVLNLDFVYKGICYMLPVYISNAY